MTLKKIEDIPVYSPQEKFSDEKIIDVVNGYVYFWCPICYIYDYTDFYKIDPKEVNKNSIYADLYKCMNNGVFVRSDLYKFVKFKEIKYDHCYTSL